MKRIHRSRSSTGLVFNRCRSLGQGADYEIVRELEPLARDLAALRKASTLSADAPTT